MSLCCTAYHRFSNIPLTKKNSYSNRLLSPSNSIQENKYSHTYIFTKCFGRKVLIKIISQGPIQSSRQKNMQRLIFEGSGNPSSFGLLSGQGTHMRKTFSNSLHWYPSSGYWPWRATFVLSIQGRCRYITFSPGRTTAGGGCPSRAAARGPASRCPSCPPPARTSCSTRGTDSRPEDSKQPEYE